MSKVLITGGTGLVGSAINLPNAVHLSRSQGDLTDETACRTIFEKFKPTHVIHCAARVGGVKANMESGADFYTENIRINTNVIDCCRIYGVEKIVNFASTCVFPAKARLPLSADMIFDGPPHESNAPYAYAKRMAIVQLEAYRKQYGLKSTTIIPCNIYGPNDNYDLETSHVIPALIRKCFEAKMNDTPLVVWGSGEPMREFVYSEDIAHFAERVLFEYGSTPPLIVSPLVQFKVSEVVTQIASIMEFEGDVVYDTSKPDGQMRKPSDSRTTLSTFCNDEFQLHGLKDGLEKTIEAYVASLTGA